MIYALINANVVVNTIVVDDASFLTHIAGDYEYVVRFDEMEPLPAVWWTYSDDVFSPGIAPKDADA